MPLDMNAMARVIAQAVKEEVGRISRDDQDIRAENVALRKELSALSETVAQMQADGAVRTKSLVDERDGLAIRINTLQASNDSLVGRIDELQASIKSLRSMDEDHAKAIGRVADTLGDVTNAVQNLPTMDDHHKQVMAAVEVAFDEEWQHKFAAMIPDSLDEDRVVAQVHDAIMKELPDMVLHAIPEVKDGAPGKDADPVDVDLLRGQVIDSLMKGLPDLIRSQMPKPLEPTDLQVLEGIKMMWPSIRHEMAKRLPKMEHRGTWDADTLYEVGDEVIKNGSSYRLMEASTDGPPSEAWQMIAQGRPGKQGKPGPTGDKGDPGDPGKDGVSFVDMTMAGTTAIVELSNGDVIEIDMTEFMELLIKAIGE